MPSEPTNREINKSVQDLTLTVQDLAEAVHALSSQTDKEFRLLDKKFATKEDLKNFATKHDLQDFKQEILDHVDWFAVQHNRYDTELLSLRSASLRHEERITTLEERAS